MLNKNCHKDDEISVSGDEEQEELLTDFLKKKFSHYNINYGSVYIKWFKFW